jgi:hypothetical protein
MTAAVPNDTYQLALGRKAAEVLKADPSQLEAGRKRMAGWMERGPYSCPEWEALLARGDVAEIVTILEADTEDGQRLRSSSPFIGAPFFTPDEAKAIHESIFA